MTAALPQVDAIAVTVARHRGPLCSLYLPRTGTVPAYYSTHVRVPQTSTVSAFVHAGGHLYVARRTVKVGIGGYGMDG